MVKDEYQIAFFHELLPYAIKNYKKGLIKPEILVGSFKEQNMIMIK